MTAYNEHTETGDVTTWNRARQIICDNPIEGFPAITCYEQQATRLPDGSIFEKSLNTLSYQMTDPSVEIPLINPDTFEQTDTTMTAGELWLALASVYIWLSKQNEPAGE